jgi:hypothetical protein
MAKKQLDWEDPKPKSDELVERDFVYAGVRVGKDFKIDCLFLLKPDGTLGDERMFKADRKGKSIGGIYGGAKFNDRQATFPKFPKYKGEFKKAPDKLVEWHALDDEAESHYKEQALEKNAKAKDVIANALEPIRRIYTAAASRGDYHTAMAIERAVAVALRKPVKD